MIGVDWTIRIGDLMQIVALIGTGLWAYHGLVVKLALLSQTLETHSRIIEDHSLRMERYEGALFNLVSDLQRMIGRLETADEGIARRKMP